MRALVALSLGMVVFAGLNASPASAGLFGGKKQPKPDYAPAYAPPPPAAPANGAIFQAANGYAPLTSGARAAMVGDVLTIMLVERTQASKASAANTDRSGDIGLI